MNFEIYFKISPFTQWERERPIKIRVVNDYVPSAVGKVRMPYADKPAGGSYGLSLSRSFFSTVKCSNPAK